MASAVQLTVLLVIMDQLRHINVLLATVHVLIAGRQTFNVRVAGLLAESTPFSILSLILAMLPVHLATTKIL